MASLPGRQAESDKQYSFSIPSPHITGYRHEQLFSTIVHFSFIWHHYCGHNALGLCLAAIRCSEKPMLLKWVIKRKSKQLKQGHPPYPKIPKILIQTIGHSGEMSGDVGDFDKKRYEPQ